jgi:hypothetical protein
MTTHKHHIIPKHAGGTDHPSNLIALSIEDHAEAHRVLWEQHGLTADFVAWKMLSGKTDEAELARIELAKNGFVEFVKDKERSASWKKNISKSLKGKPQTEQSKAKKSESLKKAYADGKRDSWFSKADKSFFQSNYNSDRMSEGRRKSSKWKDSVTSDEYRKKKSESDPRSKRVVVDGIEYSSIRAAAKGCNVPYSRMRTLLNGKNFLSLTDIR